MNHGFEIEIEEEEDYDNEYGEDDDDLEDMMSNEIMPRLGVVPGENRHNREAARQRDIVNGPARQQANNANMHRDLLWDIGAQEQ